MEDREVIDVDAYDLSLQDVDPTAYEQEQLEAAIAASLASLQQEPAHNPPLEIFDRSKTPSSSRSKSPSLPKEVKVIATSSTTSVSSFMTERLELERARLARQKRHLEISKDNTPSESPGASSSMSSDPERPAKRQKTIPSPSFSNGSSLFSLPSGSGMFWDGELRRTPSRFSAATPTFDLSTIIGDTSDLDWCIMSAMEVDFDWVAKHIPQKIPTIIPTTPPRGNEYAAAAVRILSTKWVQCMPRMVAGSGVMHTKVFLLFYKSGRLRVAVNTANLLDFDWWDIENMSWVQDFPLPSPKAHETAEASAVLGTKFKETLVWMLSKMNVEGGIQSLLKNKAWHVPSTSLDELLAQYDFSRVKVGLAASIPGKYTGKKMQTVGHTGLMRTLRDLGARCHSDMRLSLECQGSSIGRYTTDWIRGFQISAEGGGYDEWLALSTKGRAELKFPSRDELKIVYPTLKTVDQVGRQCGGSLFFTPAFWDLPKYPRELFHDSKSKTGQILMHTKMILGTFMSDRTIQSSTKGKKVVSGVNEDVGGWCYVGSHNFTPSAWGTLVRGKKPKKKGSTAKKDKDTDEEGEEDDVSEEPHISIRNFELGVVFPLPALDTQKAANDAACWRRPLVPYGSNVPWMQSKHMF